MCLRDLKDLLVSRAKKGDASILMKSYKYTEMACQYLCDDRTYTLLPEDSTPAIIERFNVYHHRCREDRVIDLGLYDHLRLANNTEA